MADNNGEIEQDVDASENSLKDAVESGDSGLRALADSFAEDDGEPMAVAPDDAIGASGIAGMADAAGMIEGLPGLKGTAGPYDNPDGTTSSETDETAAGETRE